MFQQDGFETRWIKKHVFARWIFAMRVQWNTLCITIQH